MLLEGRPGRPAAGRVGGSAASRVRGRSGGRHCTAGQYGYVPLGRHLVIITINPNVFVAISKARRQ